MKNLFINNIDNNLFTLIGEPKKDLKQKILDSIKEIINKKPLLTEFDKIFYVTNDILKDNKNKVIKKINNITIMTSDNFPYILKQLTSIKQLTDSSIIFSNGVWEWYLTEFISVYKNRNNKTYKVSMKEILKKTGLKISDFKYLNDFIFLQDKNTEDSLGEKKTRELLTTYKGIQWVIKNIDKIDNKRSYEIIKYQIEKIKYYLILKSMFITKEDIIYDKNSK